ncbi:MAG TPA: hypothetical protein VGD07_15705 [Methylomirabilota bacterium]|jgi:hypothetical protein
MSEARIDGADGHVRVPPVEDRRRFCLTGRREGCPVSQHHATAS